MKKISRILAALLVLTCCIIPALDLNVKAATQKSSDKTYYTDLFWGYSSTYLQNARVNANYSSLKSYSDETGDLIFDIYNTYIDESPKFKWTAIASGLKATFDLSEWVKIVSDGNLGTDYTYDKALEKAAMEFSKTTMSGSMFNDQLDTMSGAPQKIADGLKGVFDFFEDFNEARENADLTVSQLYTKAFNAFEKTGLLKHVKSTDLNKILNKVLEDPEKYAKYANVASHSIAVVETIITGIMLEDVRMDVLINIKNELPSNSPMRRGLELFIEKIDGGFFDYFCHSYLSEKLLKELCEKVVKELAKVVFEDIVSVYSIISTCGEIATWVVFDVILNIPSLDDLTLVFALWTFTNEIYSLINQKFTQFDSSFSNLDVQAFEVLVDAFFQMTYSALEASSELTVDSNSIHLMVVTGKAKNANYDLYIYNAQKDISLIPRAERITKHLDYACSGNTRFSKASDKIEDNTIYEFDGYIRGDLYFLGNTTNVIEEGDALRVDGNISIGQDKQSGNFFYDYYCTLQNNGQIECLGDFTVNHTGPNYGKYVQTSDNAKLLINGDVCFKYGSYIREITAGEVILRGEEQQTLTGFFAHDVTVVNPEGVKYASDAYITGHYDLNGNPLDCGGYYTVFYSSTTFDEDSDFKKLYVGESKLRIKDNGSVKGDIYIRSGNNLILDSGCFFTVDGNITIGKPYEGEWYSESIVSTLLNNGTLECTGDIKLWTGGSQQGRFVQELPRACLYVCGDVDFASWFSLITAGEVILCGEKQQTLTGLRAYNVTVTNNNGINLKTSLDLYGHMDLCGNPVTNNGNSIIMYSGASLADGSDYKNVSIYGNIMLQYNLKADVYVSGSLTIPDGADYTIDGNLYIQKQSLSESNRALLVNNGILTVTKNIQIGHFYSSGPSHISYYGTITQNSKQAKLFVKGDFNIHSSCGICDITNGKITFNGTTTQNVNGLRAYNVTVTNKNGINLKSQLNLYGHMDLCGNPVTNNGNSVVMHNGASFADGSDYKKVSIYGSVRLQSNIKADVYVSGTLTIPENTSCTIDGNLYIEDDYSSNAQNGAFVINNGTLTVTKSIYLGDYDYIGIHEYTYYGTITQNIKQAKLFVKGDFVTDSKCGISDITNGKITFNGTTTQNVNGLRAYNVTVTNKNGINLKSQLNLYGHMDLCGNPISGYSITMHNGASFADGSDYNSVSIYDSVRLRSNIKADVYVSGTLTIPENTSYTIDGNLYIEDCYSSNAQNGAFVINNGTLTVTKSIYLGDYDYIGIHEYTYYGTITQNIKQAKLFVKGDFVVNSKCGICDITNGKIIFNGNDKQTISNLTGSTIVIENSSEGSVAFEGKLQASELFEHNQNNYTVVGSATFTDYDGDGIKDNLDLYPSSVYNNGIYGDVDSDDDFTNSDITLAFRILAGFVTDNIPSYMADADANKIINNRDLIALIQKIAGWF